MSYKEKISNIDKVLSEFTTLNEILEWARKNQNNNKRIDVRGLIITEI